MLRRAHSSWIEQARADLKREGWWQFWFRWRRRDDLRAAAYELGRFTPAARRYMGRIGVLQVPTGVAWLSAVLAVALVPRWLPRAGALPKTPWIGAACLYPLPWIAGVEGALMTPVVAHELAHLIWPHLDPELRRQFPSVLAELETRDPELTRLLDTWLREYKDPRSPDECHVRLLERYEYGRTPLPPELRPFYQGWVEPSSLE